jgi:hypothetical protein
LATNLDERAIAEKVAGNLTTLFLATAADFDSPLQKQGRVPSGSSSCSATSVSAKNRRT